MITSVLNEFYIIAIKSTLISMIVTLVIITPLKHSTDR